MALQVVQTTSKLIRSLISSGLDQLDSTAPVYKVYCLALVSALTTSSGSDALTESRADPESSISVVGEIESKSTAEDQLREAYEGWLARHGFVAKMRRCRPVIISVGTKGFIHSECPECLSGVPSIAGG